MTKLGEIVKTNKINKVSELWLVKDLRRADAGVPAYVVMALRRNDDGSCAGWYRLTNGTLKEMRNYIKNHI